MLSHLTCDLFLSISTSLCVSVSLITNYRMVQVLAHEAAVQSQMKMNQHDAHAIGSVKVLLKAESYMCTCIIIHCSLSQKIEFVADKDIPVHVPNTTEEMPHLLAMSGQIRKMPKRSVRFFALTIMIMIGSCPW